MDGLEPEVHRRLGRHETWRRAGRLREALDELEAAISLSESPSRLHLIAARTLLKLQDPVRALPHAQAALRFQPDSAAAHLLAAEAALRQDESARAGARSQARRLQGLVRTRKLADLLEQFDALSRRWPDEAVVRTHRGELLLWAGQFKRAKEDFQGALELSRLARWAYIGLSAVEMLEGRLDEALAWFERLARAMPPAGDSLPVYRGELFRRLGRREEAERELSDAVRRTPGRVGAWINLALLRLDAGREEEARRISTATSVWARPLFRQAERTSGGLDTRALLERALELMRGNRSSVIHTFATESGELVGYVTSWSPAELRR